MEISQWVSASGWILENSQQSHITVLLSMLKKHHHHDHHPQHKHYQKKTSSKVTHSEVLLSQKKNPTPKQNTNTKVCSLLRSLVLEGYWIFLFPGKTAKVFSFQTEKSPILHMTTKGLFEFGSGTVCRFHLDWASPAQSHKGWAKLLPKSLPPAAQGHS